MVHWFQKRLILNVSFVQRLQPSWIPDWHKLFNFLRCYPMIIHAELGFILFIFPVGSYFKTLSCSGGHLGWFLVDNETSTMRNIHTKKQFHHTCSVRKGDFLNFSQAESIIYPNSHVDISKWNENYIKCTKFSSNWANV